MNKKYIILGVVVVILAGTGVYFTVIKKSEKTTSGPVVTPPSNTEAPLEEKNVSEQPAYLLAAYSKNGKNYIDVDYVEWLHGDAASKAMLADGECYPPYCEAYGNGYKRNKNPMVRTFQVSSSVSILVNGVGLVAHTIELGDYESLDSVPISFETLQSALPKMNFYKDQFVSPFKEPKVFVTIDVKKNMVTKIFEPYQE